MTSRERILNAVNHRPVDRLPVDFGGTRQTGISAWAYDRLRRHLGLRDSRLPRVFDVYQMLAEVEQEVAERFGADCVGLNRPSIVFGLRNENWKVHEFHGGLRAEVPGGFSPERGPDGTWILRQHGHPVAAMPSGGFYFDRLEKHPGATHPDLAQWRAPRADEETLAHFHARSEALNNCTDKAIVVAMGPPFELFYGLGQGGFEDWMVTFALEDDWVRGLYDELVTAWLENLRRLCEAVGNRIQVLQICDDFGTQHAPFLSVRMFREKLLPAYKRGLDWVHANTGWKVLLHSDGAIYPLLPSIIEMGVDILNPVQTSATGMDPARLKADFGTKLAFWGGSCDGQSTLSRGTPEEVRAETQRNVSILGAGSGYVCASIHNIQANVPPGNIVALFDSARECGAG